MVATVKIIPFAVPRAVVDAASAHGGRKHRLRRALEAAPRGARGDRAARAEAHRHGQDAAHPGRAAEARGRRPSSTRRASRTTPRISPMRSRCCATEGADLLIAFGASAITDENDVIPAAIRAAGGEVSHFGMPVDPGNLLLIGELDGRPVLGAPGCARSPAENGFDWVLNRLLAGLEVSREDITGMGVGGLLMEIVSRPQPREPAARGGRQEGRGHHPGGGPGAPHGRAEQAHRPLRRRAAGAARRGAGAEIEGRPGDRGHRPPVRRNRIRAVRPGRADGGESGLCRRPRHLAESWPRGSAGRRGGRARHPRRHAGRHDRRARPAHRMPSGRGAGRRSSCRPSAASAAIRCSGRATSSPS